MIRCTNKPSAMNAGIVDQDRDIASDFFDLRSYLRRLCGIRDVPNKRPGGTAAPLNFFRGRCGRLGIDVCDHNASSSFCQRQRNFFTQTLAGAGYYRRLSVQDWLAVQLHGLCLPPKSDSDFLLPHATLYPMSEYFAFNRPGGSAIARVCRDCD